MEVAVDKACRNVEHASVYKPAASRRTAVMALGVLLYALVLPYAWNTMGEPRRRAVLEAEQIEARELADEEAWIEQDAGEVVLSWDDENVAEAAEAGFADDVIEPESDLPKKRRRRKRKVVRADGDESGTAPEGEALLGEFEEDEEDEEEARPLPSPYLPDAGAAAALFCLLTGTALFQLLCHWFVWFYAMMYFEPTDKVKAGTYVLVLPYAHRGQPALVLVTLDEKSGNLVFEFQRQKFELLSELPLEKVKLMGLSKANERMDHDDEDLLIQKLSPEQLAAAEKKTLEAVRANGVFTPVVCPVDKPVSFYIEGRGLSTKKAVENQMARYGINSLQMEMKTMPMLIKEGLLSPLSMFQFFSAALWLMDEYWQYTIFNLFTIVLMEAMTAFQRFRTLKTLKGLAPKPYELPVYREHKWVMLKTTDLLPGDLVSLSSSAHAVAPAVAAAPQAPGAAPPAQQAPGPSAKSGTDAVPCDCVIVHGSAVVNEATLTGESVPQMKDALKSTTHSDPTTPLDVKGRDQVHVMFSGTTLISATPGEAESSGAADSDWPKTPDGGCLCYVLRTGFGSSQGELMQMIEFSTEKVSADSKETGIALLVLLGFAICSAGYVFKRGMEKGDRTTHELLLKCIIILTSVVPRQLPVQMALAVNHALMTLIKEGIFCTEPFRVPYSGKITHCLFDKTGTLTTDELVPVGVVNAGQAHAADVAANDMLKPVREADEGATMVLAACHSLVAMPDKPVPVAAPGAPPALPAAAKPVELLGDPIELAAMKGVQWSFDPKTQRAAPGDLKTIRAAIETTAGKVRKLETLRSEAMAKAGGRLPEVAEKSFAEQLKELKEKSAKLEETLAAAKAAAAKSPVQAIKILQRFHFSSKLQRMSVICKVQPRGQNELEAAPRCLVKGSPEAVQALLAEGATPPWYRNVYRTLAEQGMRVLALGHKTCAPDVDLSRLSRDEAEAGLTFAGFIAFECKTRTDSAMVIKSLREADHRVAMLTGDAPLTALHVARTTNICGDPERRDNPPLLLTATAVGEGEGEGNLKVEWVGAVGAEEDCIRVAFEADQVAALAAKHDLLTTEAALLEAVHQSQGRLWRYVDHIQVFARMSPQGKAKVIRMIQQFQDKEGNPETESFAASAQKNFVLMCGDGGNDVGALKQADVGLALLSGYGSANTDGTSGAGAAGEAAAAAAAGDADAEAALNERARVLKARTKKAEKEKKAALELKKKELMSRQRQMVEEEVRRLEAAGQTGMWTQLTAVKNVTQRVRVELQRESEMLNRKFALQVNKGDSAAGDADKDPTELAMEALDDPNALPVVRPGDASVAAPFTSRIPSVRSAVQLIRQGRCTLLSALQQQQIMMLECVISAYCLAALSLEGARSSERQMMASSWLIMTASLAFSYSTPIDKMHPVRPIRSLFHPAIFLSILGQAAIHLFCMITAVDMAKSVMGEDKLREVILFNRRVSRGLEKKLEQESEGLDAVADMLMMWSTPFMPNLMNTVIFLVETSQIMAVLFVNYKGRPWMLGMLENHALFLSLFLCVGALIFFSWEVSPELNKLIHLHPFPDDAFRFKLIGLVMTTLFGTFAWDRLITAIFAPKIFRAMMEQASQTTIKDIMPIFTTLLKVSVGFAIFSTGNPLVWFGTWWMYKRRQRTLEEREIAELTEGKSTAA